MKKTLILILLYIKTATAQSSMIAIPFNKQLTESQGVILGEFLGINYKKDKNDKILTEASFRLIKSVGVENRFLVNQNLIKISYEGGIWQGLEYSNPNAPSFEFNKNYIVLLKRHTDGFSPYMDRVGVYEYVKERKKTFVKSTAFPEHKMLGNIPEKTFNLWVRTAFGEHMAKRNSDKYVHKPKEKMIGRKPTSQEREPSSVSSEGGIGIIWISMIFGFLGALRIRKVKKS